MNQVKLAYLAGIIDGEGTVTILKRLCAGCKEVQYWPVVRVSTTTRALVNWLLENVGGSSYVHRRNPYSIEYGWRYEYKKAVDLCHKLLPYFIIKVNQAKLVIEFGKTYDTPRTRWRKLSPEVRERRKRLCEEIQAMNAPGGGCPDVCLTNASTL